jgi:hypothetical protein
VQRPAAALLRRCYNGWMSSRTFVVLAFICLAIAFIMAVNGSRNAGDLQAADLLGEVAAGLFIAAALAGRGPAK